MIVLVGMGVALYIPLRIVSLLISDYFGAPFEPLAMDLVRKSLQLIGPQPGQRILDMGSGDARVLIEAVRQYQMQAVGYELAWYPYLVSFIRLHYLKLWSEITIVFANFFKADLTTFDVVMSYQEPPEILLLRDKYLREMPDHAWLISPRFKVPDWPVTRSDTSGQYPIYVYAMGTIRQELKFA